MSGKVLVNCLACGNAGIKKAMPIKLRLGEICSICGGSGSVPMELFNGKVEVDDVELVAVSALTHYRYPQGSISYKDFRAGKMPAIMPNSIKEDGEKFNRGKVEQFLDRGIRGS